LKYLITGGCGFIGINLVDALLREGAEEIRIVDNLSSGRLEYLKELLSQHSARARRGKITRKTDSKVRFIRGDIRDYRLTKNATKGVGTVIHLAAQVEVMASIESPAEDMEINLKGTLNSLEASRKNEVQNFVFASSNAVLGEQAQPVDELMSPKPISPYGASKLAGEAYCLVYHNTYGLRTVVLRFSNIYGPWSYHKESVISKFFKNALSGKPLTVYGDGNQTRDFLYVDDLCEAMLTCTKKSGVAGEIFQIGSSKETSINQLVLEIKSLLKRVEGIDIGVTYVGRRKGEIVRSCSNIEKARKILGYAPKTSMKEGLEKTWKWFKNTRGRWSGV
jgi:UDP-glucose 4-epimerase